MAQEEKKYLSESGLQRLVEIIKAGFARLTHTHELSDITDYEVDAELSQNSENPVQNKVIKSALDEKVPITRTVNGKPLSTNINLSASDVGAANSIHIHEISDINNLQTTIDTINNTKSQVQIVTWEAGD